jgi:uncharacterized membrane protein
MLLGSKEKKLFFSIIIIFIVGLLYAYSPNRQVWFDEAFSVEYSQHDISYIIQPLDVHPPLYYLLLHGFMSGSPSSVSPVDLRMFSLLFIIISVIFIYSALDEMFKDFYEKNIYLLFTAALALTTTFLHYFTEIRMYAIAIMFTAGSFYCMIRIVKDNGKSKWNRIFFVVFAALAGYTHYYTAMFFLMECLYIAWHMKWNVIKKLKAEIIAFCILIIPLLVYFYYQKIRIAGTWYLDSNWLSALATFHYYFFYSSGNLMPIIYSIIGISFVIMCFALIGIGIGKSTGWDKDNMIWMFLFATIPPFIGMTVNFFIMKIYHHRLFVFFGWMFIFLVIYSVTKLRSKITKVIIFMIILAVTVFNIFLYCTIYDFEVKGASDAMRLDGCDSGLYVVHESMFSMLESKYYNELNNCTLIDYIYSQNFTRKEMNSAGFDAIDENLIFNNTDLIQFADKGYYYFRNKGYFVNDTSDFFDCVTLYDAGGLYLDRCQKKPVTISISFNG